MTDKNKTLLAVIMDRSGSMSSLRDETISGFNAFLKAQQEMPGECTLYYTQFDDVYEIVHKNIPIAEMKPLDYSTYEPRGYTALLDAIGQTINAVGQQLGKMSEDERPGSVIFCVQTDGLENRSREYKRQQIANMIEHQRNLYNWQFIFIGASEESVKEAHSLNFSSDAAMQYGGQHTNSAFTAVSSNVRRVRMSTASGQSVPAQFTQQEREEANKPV